MELTTRGNTKTMSLTTFEQLVNESQMTNPNPYKTEGYLEYEAQQVEVKAEKLYKLGWPFKNGNAK